MTGQAGAIDQFHGFAEQTARAVRKSVRPRTVAAVIIRAVQHLTIPIKGLAGSPPSRASGRAIQALSGDQSRACRSRCLATARPRQRPGWGERLRSPGLAKVFE